MNKAILDFEADIRRMQERKEEGDRLAREANTTTGDPLLRIEALLKEILGELRASRIVDNSHEGESH